MDFASLRRDFPILQRRINNKPIIYFDNSATSLKPVQVIEAEAKYYNEECANIHRGVHKLSERATFAYETAHKNAAKFIDAKSWQEIVFVRNTTEAFNLLMYSFFTSGMLKKDDEVLVTKFEHHSNLVPWQFLERKIGIKLKFAELNPDFSLNLQDLQNKITKNIKIVSVTHIANSTGTINDVKQIGKIAHDNKALFLVDAAQSAPHMELDAKNINADFLAFSGHKMLAPTGIGVLYGKRELLEKMQPFMYGGDMIRSVQLHSATWNDLPYKFEAGTPNIAAAYGFSAAIDYLQRIGMHAIRKHEIELTKYALDTISSIPKIKIYGTKNPETQAGIVLFESKGLEAHDLALALDESANIAIRSGMLCAEPFVGSINPNGLDRASFYFYNTKEEIDIFTEELQKIVKAFG
jgi:cysteine desulfurase/selenocysteine lyase